MKDPRPEKVAVVDELKQKFADTDGTILTEYRGLDVSAMAKLRNALRQAGGEYKIYKNTLVRIAARDAGLEIEDLLVGPTALAFVGERPDGSDGDVAAVAKALREFAKTNQIVGDQGWCARQQTARLGQHQSPCRAPLARCLVGAVGWGVPSTNG